MAGGDPTRNFTWNPARVRAAELLAADTATDEAIAVSVAVSRRTLGLWKRIPAFAARIEERRAAQRAAIEDEGIADKRRRIACLNERHGLMARVIAARAQEHAAVPGGDTGLLVREPKLVKVYDVKHGRSGGAADDEALTPTGRVQIVHEYAVDTALLAELRATEKQAAQEAGQWTEKRELTGKDGGPLRVETRPDLSRLTDEELVQFERLADKATPDAR